MKNLEDLVLASRLFGPNATVFGVLKVGEPFTFPMPGGGGTPEVNVKVSYRRYRTPSGRTFQTRQSAAVFRVSPDAAAEAKE